MAAIFIWLGWSLAWLIVDVCVRSVDTVVLIYSLSQITVITNYLSVIKT